MPTATAVARSVKSVTKVTRRITSASVRRICCALVFELKSRRRSRMGHLKRLPNASKRRRFAMCPYPKRGPWSL